jgi:polysaccharide export outer membrane protein
MIDPRHFLLRVLGALLFVLPLPVLAEDEPQKFTDSSYILRPNDAIRLSVYEEPDLSVAVRILKTGQAAFPLIGSVDIGGLSVAAAEKKIHALYAEDYLVDPKLTLTVDDYATDFISVIGAVRSPGNIPIPVSGHLDLAAAIATAGGLADNADNRNIELRRAEGATTTYSMSAIDGAAGSTLLSAGDRIMVAESRFVGKSLTLLGQVRRPGAVQFPNDGKLDIVTALALAGGVTELANPRKVSINRKGRVFEVDFREIAQRGDRPLMLEPDDIITVPERWF